MLRSRDEIAQDSYFGPLTEAILARDQPRTTDLFEEYAHNTTHWRDRLLLATPRLLAGWLKMPGERDCYARFETEWRHH
jgi:hypothetical protein